MGGGTAREHIRVGRALLELPLLRTEFAAGRLTFSKVRALTRIATPALESELVALGLGMPAAHVERLVRSYRRAETLERPAVPRVSSLNHRWEDDGSLTLTLRMCADEGATVLAAVEAYRAILDVDKQRSTATETPRVEPESSEQHASDPADGVAPARSADGAAATSAPADSAVEPSTPVDNEPAECPTLDTPRRPSPVADAEAFLALVTSAMAQGPIDRSGSDRFEVVIHADADQLQRIARSSDGSQRWVGDLEPAVTGEEPGDRDPVRRGRCHLRDGSAIYPETLRRMACDARIRLMAHGPDGSPRDVSRAHRLVTPALRRLLEERDDGRCRFPTCWRRRRLHAHHVVHWSQGGPTDLDNLILLCPFHHQLVHEQGFSVAAVTPGSFTFNRPDGVLLHASPSASGDPRLDMLDEGLYRPPPITDETTTPEWWGDPLHVADAVDGLLRRREAAVTSAADLRQGAPAGTPGTASAQASDNVPAGTPDTAPAGTSDTAPAAAADAHDPWSRPAGRARRPASLSEAQVDFHASANSRLVSASS